jgi:hypothetical protein
MCGGCFFQDLLPVTQEHTAFSSASGISPELTQV